MKPFKQGTVDTFCAVYAVLNALKITHNIKTLEARTVLNNLLISLSKDETVFERVLTLKTNYIAMVDSLLEVITPKYPMRVTQPFEKNIDDKEKVWSSIANFIDPDAGRTAIFQFEKRLPLSTKEIFAHWSTAWSVYENEIHLFDSSPEDHAVQVLYKDSLQLTQTILCDGEYLCLNAKTIRLIEAI